jgi:DNA-binding transcriptional ArsR family regulator
MGSGTCNLVVVAESKKRELTPAGIEFPTEDQMQAAVQTFGMLGDPTRLRILWSLLQGEQTVNRLAELVGVQQPTVSQHLAKLRMAHLVRQRRKGSFVFYEVDRKHVRPLLKQALGQANHSAPSATGRSAATPGANRIRLDGGAAPAIYGWTLNHGHSVSAASSAGFAINAPVVLASIAVGTLLLSPLSRVAGHLTHRLESRSRSARSIKLDPTSRNQYRLSPGSVVATLVVAAIALGAILFDISRYDPTGTALAWSPGVAVLSFGAASFLNRVSRQVVGSDTEVRALEESESRFWFGAKV